MTRPLIPSPADIVGPGAIEICQQRPGSFDNINFGRGTYALVLAGLRAQAALAASRLADGVKGTSLRLGKGAQLRAYADSEAAVIPDPGSTKAVGTVTLDRSASIAPLLGGSIPKGKRLSRLAEPIATVPIGGAEYVVSSDVPVLFGQTVVNVTIEATRAGSASNTPRFSPSPYKQLVLTDSLYDSSFVTTSYEAGGGSDGIVDADVVRYALAYAKGKDGPTDAAIVLAALGAAGVKHILIQDPAAVGAVVYAADQSWGGSERWRSAVEQSIANSEFTGYGCRIAVALINNVVAMCTLTVRLRDSSYLSDTTEIDAAIKKATRAYFDDRADFNVFGVQQLRGIVSRADRRILRCTAAAINKLDGSSLTYAAPSFNHVYLSDNAVSITYQGPV